MTPDAVLTADATIELARAALDEITYPDTVGGYLGFDPVDDRVGTLYFESTAAGYVGWRWAVVVARAPRAKFATISETNLVPGDGALLSPQWLPYAERLKPGDLGPQDVLPYQLQDPFLEPGFEATGEEDVDQVALWELGLGRPRVLSAEGRDVAATRWMEGSNGPLPELATMATCSTCGYFVPMAGILRREFGVCANAWSPSDGSVVALQHGCGAHSETDMPDQPSEVIQPPILDDSVLDVSPTPVPASNPDDPEEADTSVGSLDVVSESDGSAEPIVPDEPAAPTEPDGSAAPTIPDEPAAPIVPDEPAEPIVPDGSDPAQALNDQQASLWEDPADAASDLGATNEADSSQD